MNEHNKSAFSLRMNKVMTQLRLAAFAPKTAPRKQLPAPNAVVHRRQRMPRAQVCGIRRMIGLGLQLFRNSRGQKLHQSLECDALDCAILFGCYKLSTIQLIVARDFLQRKSTHGPKCCCSCCQRCWQQRDHAGSCWPQHFPQTACVSREGTQHLDWTNMRFHTHNAV